MVPSIRTHETTVYHKVEFCVLEKYCISLKDTDVLLVAAYFGSRKRPYWPY